MVVSVWGFCHMRYVKFNFTFFALYKNKTPFNLLNLPAVDVAQGVTLSVTYRFTRTTSFIKKVMS